MRTAHGTTMAHQAKTLPCMHKVGFDTVMDITPRCPIPGAGPFITGEVMSHRWALRAQVAIAFTRNGFAGAPWGPKAAGQDGQSTADW